MKKCKIRSLIDENFSTSKISEEMNEKIVSTINLLNVLNVKQNKLEFCINNILLQYSPTDLEDFSFNNKADKSFIEELQGYNLE